MLLREEEEVKEEENREGSNFLKVVALFVVAVEKSSSSFSSSSEEKGGERMQVVAKSCETLVLFEVFGNNKQKNIYDSNFALKTPIVYIKYITKAKTRTF